MLLSREAAGVPAKRALYGKRLTLNETFKSLCNGSSALNLDQEKSNIFFDQLPAIPPKHELRSGETQCGLGDRPLPLHCLLLLNGCGLITFTPYTLYGVSNALAVRTLHRVIH